MIMQLSDKLTTVLVCCVNSIIKILFNWHT